MAVDIGPRIGIQGDKEFRKGLQDINQQLKAMGSEMKAVTSAFDESDDAEKRLGERTRILNSQIELQKKKIEELKKGLQMSAKQYGETDSKTQRWQQSVHDATAELNRMQKELRDSEKGMSDLEEEADKADRTFSDLSGTLKKGFAIGSVVAGVKELSSALMGVVRDTQEYRTVMASLEVSSKNAGYTAEETSVVYKKLYSVLGDNQTAATATANLQAIGLSQSQLIAVTNAAIGAWATYGDSIPIDQLAESINLGAQQSEVSSALADAIEWAGGNVDEFKARLEAANSAEERANIIAQELASQGLAAAGAAWQSNNEDITAVNKAQAEWDEAMSELGEMLAPLGASIISFGADAIGALVDWLKSAVENTKAAYEWLRKFFDFEAREGRRHELLPGPVDGSHASGLRYVPFDGYTAELHKGEMVLTAAQADRIRGVSSGGSDYRGMMSGLVNAVNTMQTGTAIPEEITLTLKSDNGQTMGRWLVPFVRSENKSNPEVVSDPT